MKKLKEGDKVELLGDGGYRFLKFSYEDHYGIVQSMQEETKIFQLHFTLKLYDRRYIRVRKGEWIFFPEEIRLTYEKNK